MAGNEKLREALAKMREGQNPTEAVDLEGDVPPKCDVCLDMGMVRPDVPFGHDLFGRMVRCPNPNCEIANKNRKRALESASPGGVLPQYRKYTVNNWLANLSKNQQHGKMLAWGSIKALIDSGMKPISLNDGLQFAGYKRDNDPDYKIDRNWIVLFGDYGTGKTSLMGALINTLEEDGMVCTFTRLKDMLMNVQSRYGKLESPSANDVIRELQQVPVLAIDEFDIDNKTNDRLEIIESIIRYRGAASLPTIITTNFMPADIEQEFGRRTSEILWEKAHWIYMNGSIRRIRGGFADPE